MGPEESASEDDITDAIGEIANMLGGGVKKRLSGREPKLQLGLPIFVEGRIHAAHQAQTAFEKIRLGATTVELLVIKANRT
jgi:CheY-specific phosphatase CheX